MSERRCSRIKAHGPHLWTHADGLGEPGEDVKALPNWVTPLKCPGWEEDRTWHPSVAEPTRREGRICHACATWKCLGCNHRYPHTTLHPNVRPRPCRHCGHDEGYFVQSRHKEDNHPHFSLPAEPQEGPWSEK